jgi:uncharacterized membrane protein
MQSLVVFFALGIVSLIAYIVYMDAVDASARLSRQWVKETSERDRF